MASESIAHSAFGLMAIDSEPIRARGIIAHYICFCDYEAYVIEPPDAITSRKGLNIQNTKTFPGHVVGSRPMKRKKHLHRMIVTYLHAINYFPKSRCVRTSSWKKPLWFFYRKRPPPVRRTLSLHSLGGRFREVLPV